MKEYVLLYNGRRRVYIVEKIKEYLKHLNKDIGICITDTDKLDPVAYHGDKFFIVPPIEDKDWSKKIIPLLKKNNIKYIFLWNNKDFMPFYKIKDELEKENIKILLPSIDVINICFDKKLTNEFALNNNILTPTTFYSIEDFIKNPIDFPVLIKPSHGAGNMNIFKAYNIEELEILYKRVPDPIIQEFIDGFQVTIDIFYDKDVKAIVPRKRVKVRDAEVVQASIILDDYLIEAATKVANALNTDGPLNIQVMCRDNKAYLIDLHPRFGGGTDLSIEAGVDIHKWIINMLLGIENNYNYKLNNKLFMTRYLKSEFFEMSDL